MMQSMNKLCFLKGVPVWLEAYYIYLYNGEQQDDLKIVAGL